MSKVLSKLLWQLYFFILIVSVVFLYLSSSYLWKSIVNESETELTYTNRFVSNSLVSLLNKNESLFRITGERLLQIGFSNNNQETIKLLDDILSHNPELAGIAIVSPQGDPRITTSNIKKENITNLLEKEETKHTFIEALNSDAIVIGRTYFLKEVNDWIVPIRFRILNAQNSTVAVFTTGIKLKGKNFPWQNIDTKDALRISVIGADNYFQFASYIKPEELNQVYSTPLAPEFLESFDTQLYRQTGLTIDDFKTGDRGIVYIGYQNPVGKQLVGTFSYSHKYGHFIFTTMLKSILINKFKLPMSWLCFLVIGFNLILFLLFKYLSKIQRKSKADLMYQSQHDLLTGLPNLRYLSEHFKKWKRKKKMPYSIVFIDLDNFKNSNDIHGHSVGDAILSTVAQRINDFFNKGLSVRQGGDEFIVVIPNSSKNNTINYCNKFLEELKQPIKVDDLVFSIRASIGIAHSPQDGLDLETLLRKADIAMYEAKRKKCGVNVFTTKLDKRHTRIAMIGKELNNAIDNNEFSLVYQPQVELATNRVIGAEVLLRWNNEILSAVPPSEFIPIAESTGAILEIGKFVLDEVFEEFQEVCHKFLENDAHFNSNNRFRLSINVSIMQLSDHSFLEHLLSLFNKFNCTKSKLVLEITETLIIANIDKIGTILSQIREAGIEIALDDFGTGYSSLSYLISLPINELKIDKSFVQGMTTNKNSFALIRSIINLGASLDLDVVAEGIETLKHVEELQKNQCKYGQGYYYSKPLNINNLLDYLKNSSQ